MAADNLTNPSDAFVEGEEDAPDSPETPETDTPEDQEPPPDAPAPTGDAVDLDAEKATADDLAQVHALQTEKVEKLVASNAALRKRVGDMTEAFDSSGVENADLKAKVVALERKLASAGVAL